MEFQFNFDGILRGFLLETLREVSPQKWRFDIILLRKGSMFSEIEERKFATIYVYVIQPITSIFQLRSVPALEDEMSMGGWERFDGNLLTIQVTGIYMFA